MKTVKVNPQWRLVGQGPGGDPDVVYELHWGTSPGDLQHWMVISDNQASEPIELLSETIAGTDRSGIPDIGGEIFFAVATKYPDGEKPLSNVVRHVTSKKPKVKPPKEAATLVEVGLSITDPDFDWTIQ